MMMNMKITVSDLDLIMCIYIPLVAFLIRITITSDNLSFTNLFFFKKDKKSNRKTIRETPYPPSVTKVQTLKKLESNKTGSSSNHCMKQWKDLMKRFVEEEKAIKNYSRKTPRRCLDYSITFRDVQCRKKTNSRQPHSWSRLPLRRYDMYGERRKEKS